MQITAAHGGFHIGSGLFKSHRPDDVYSNVDAITRMMTHVERPKSNWHLGVCEWGRQVLATH
jgi:hypothetical protein